MSHTAVLRRCARRLAPALVATLALAAGATAAAPAADAKTQRLKGGVTGGGDVLSATGRKVH